MKKKLHSEIKLKELLANEDVNKAVTGLVHVPDTVLVKEVSNPFVNKETNKSTQRVKAYAGTSMADMFEVEFTLVDITIDAKESINKYFRFVEYYFGFIANMSNGNFSGYSATGLKYLVTKIEEVKGQSNEKPKG